MTATDQQIRALVFLAKDCRPTGARRWDEAGIVAAITAIRSWGLPELIAEVITAASDRHADTPGVIGKQGRTWGSLQTWQPETAPVGTRCTICGGVMGGPHHGHDYSPPRPEMDQAQVRELVNRTKATLMATAGPSEHRGPDDFAEADPDLHANVERARAAIANEESA